MKTDLIKPTIHLNGTSGRDLLESYLKAIDAIRDAVIILGEASPNGRDYYPQGEAAIREAANQHKARVDKLLEANEELIQLAEHCQQFINE